MSTSDLPLLAAGRDVVVRYKRGNDMLSSSAIGLRNLKTRVDNGERDEDGVTWLWDKYRATHLQELTKAWINKQLALAPPGATEDQVADNVAARREKEAQAARERRQRGESAGAYVGATLEQASPPAFSASASNPSGVNHQLEELVQEFNALNRKDQDEFLRRVGAVRAGLRVVA